MRKLYLANGNSEFKFADTTTEICLNAFDDSIPANLAENAKVRVKNSTGYLLEVNASIKDNQATITSGQLDQLPVGSYLLELWDITANGGTAIYPSDGFLRLQINGNVTGISGELISSITVDDFTQHFNILSQKLKKEVADAVAKGVKGDKGDPGKDFRIVKTFPSISKMNGSGLSDGDFVMIASDVSDPDDGKLYAWNDSSFTFVADLSGFQGIKGEKGDKGDTGATGPQGSKGDKGDPGLSAYQIAVNAGFKGSQTDWLSSIGGAKGAGAHNSIYRGDYLGNAFTETQAAAIRSGTFDGLFIGNYWTIGGVNYRIAAFNYYLGTGDKACTDPHIVIVPDVPLYWAKMNETDTTAGGYVGSEMYKTGLSKAKDTITAAFGSNHLLTHRNELQNACTNGVPTGNAWFDSTVELMTEQNVYGNQIMGPLPSGGTVNPWDANGNHNYLVDKTQFPLFAFRPDLISNQNWFWLRTVVSAAYFAGVDGDGVSSCGGVGASGGVRPAFSIC
ncbi:collagen-like protein [Lactobacillus delbrueckii subsp. bulgaricus]